MINFGFYIGCIRSTRTKKKFFFDCDFGCVVALSYLIGKFGQSGNKVKEDLGGCIRQIHTHLRRKIVPYSRALGAVRVWESFFIDFRNFRSEVALNYLIGQLGQSQGT